MSLIDDVQSAVIVLTEDGQSFAPVKWWPESHAQDNSLSAIAELAIKERRGIVKEASNPSPSNTQNNDNASGFLAYPFIVDGNLYGVVALKLGIKFSTDLSVAMRKVQWGVAWLELLYKREATNRPAQSDERVAYLLDLINVSLEHANYKSAATAVTSKLASELNFERVSIGFWKTNIVELDVLSHSASFSEKASLIQAISLAMTEAVDQSKTIIYPAIVHNDFYVSSAHQQLVDQYQSVSVCSIPIRENDRVVGAITFEASATDIIDHDTVMLCEAVTAFIGTILFNKRNAEQSLTDHVIKSGSINLSELLDSDHPFKKLSYLSVFVLLLFMIFFNGTYRVTADMRLEGEIQRVVSAAVDGYIAEATVRAGDEVKKGQVLYKLDDTDLKLERVNAISQREQYIKQYRDARARSERSQINIIKAKLEQSKARLGLIDEQLLRIHGVAPFDGVIVSGDLSQSLGAPVTQGDLLFEVAPLDAYRVILEVNESDISYITEGQSGQLILTSGLDKELSLKITRITPVAITRDGRNFFEVEAQVLNPPEFLRPGLKGIAKVHAGEQRLIWIWTHALTDWLRLTIWRYLP